MRYPMLMQPICKDYLWGGTKLRTKYNKRCGLDNIAESWELAVHEDGISRIGNGHYAGMMLSDYITQNKDVLGTRCQGELPLLVKFIDTKGKLSVQVHPDDDYAQRHHNSPGKTEFWYIMDCADDAELYYGFSKKVETDEFKRRANDGSIEQVLNKVHVRPGDSFVIQPGMVHAIGENMTVAEIGSNCNITYRIYDYGRVDKDGQPRELHIDHAAEVYIPKGENMPFEDGVIDCGPFIVKRHELHGMMTGKTSEESFTCLMCVKGNCVIDRGTHMQEGSSVLIPAGLSYTINGTATLLQIEV